MNRGALALLTTLMVAFPLMLGGNRPWALGLVSLLLWAALLVVAMVGVVFAPRVLPGPVWAQVRGAPGAVWPLALLLLLALIPAAQLAGVLTTVDPFLTSNYLVRTLLCVAAFALTLVAVPREELARKILLAAVVAGLVQAFLAIALKSLNLRWTLFYSAVEVGPRAAGTFANPDHLAGFMELSLAAGLGLLVANLGDEGRKVSRWQDRLLAVLRFMLSPKMMLRLLMVVMVVALVMTHSRMGNAAFFITLLLVGLFTAWRSLKLRRPALWVVASMVVVDIVVLGQLVGLDRVVDRLQDTDYSIQADPDAPPGSAAAASAVAGPRPQNYREESLQARLRTPRVSLELVEQQPWWGWGGGVFDRVFPRVRTPEIYWGKFDYAHNDYVQQAVEVGLVGMLLWVGVGLLAGWRAVRLLRDDQPRLSRGVAVCTLVALGCLGLHSLVDFNLQMPANAMLFTVLLALPYTVPVRPSARQRGRSDAATLPEQPDDAPGDDEAHDGAAEAAPAAKEVPHAH
ncbi:O-antigen ligase family protein [Ideonella sp. 4Y11]|uniref:O-antigen ligase family protein n=1 Tax=Ideonella aquatica TaxID=2824119 RepID=A0A940YN25_9BURK|nr:O-antigen ligase family protein [Ideonella aquatica]